MFTGYFFTDFWVDILTLGAPKAGFSHGVHYQTFSSQKSFLNDVGRLFCLSEASGADFLIFAALKTGSRIDGLTIKPDPETLAW